MNYRFSEEIFKGTFNWKSLEERSVDSCRITHHQNIRFKLFPYTANGQTPIVTDMEEVIGDFIKVALEIESTDTDFQSLIKNIEDAIDNDEEYLEHIIHTIFYRENKFVADNIGLYAYKGASENASVEKLAKYLNDVFGIDCDDKKAINDAMQRYPYNALEKLVTESLGSVSASKEKEKGTYFTIFEDAGKLFKQDFHFMLENGMSAPEDLSDLLALYYLYYTSQTCIILDQFGGGNRTEKTKLYFALDWEKVSANRECCKGGWNKLCENVAHIFSHAITLELLNQTEDPGNVVDYKMLSDTAKRSDLDDQYIASEISKIEKIYRESVGDYKDFASISYTEGINKTDAAMRHLFECVKAQFSNRKAANDKYVNKLLEFYRTRWLKNRKKAGLVFNLTERDIIFLTKISIQGQDRIRLVDLFKEYEKRGVCLDNISKSMLQDFFTRLNLLDKKSDSGDAQYVKRIL